MVEKNKLFYIISNKIEPFLFWLFLSFAFCGKTGLLSIFGRTFHISFWISLVSVPLFLLILLHNKNRTELFRLLTLSLVIIIPLTISSFGNVIIFNQKYDGFLNENILLIWLENLLKYLYDFLIIIYLIIHFQNEKIDKYFKPIYIFFVIWVIVGFGQMLLIILQNNLLWSIYEKLDFLNILAHRDILSLAGLRFYSFLSEPSENAKIICLFFLPFFLVKTLKKDSSLKSKIFNASCLLLTIICSFLTKSSTVYVGVLVCLIVFFIFFIIKSDHSKKTIIILSSIVAFVAIVLIAIPYTRTNIISILINKVFGTSSFSTRYRYSSVYNDIIIFLKFPLFGIGDGMQGVFYLENVGGTWMSYSFEAQQSLIGENGIIEGGAIIPSFISAFGIFGIVVILVFLKIIKRNYSFSLFKSNEFLLYFIPAFISFAVVMTVGADFHRNYPLFIFLAIPFFGEVSKKEMFGFKRNYCEIAL